MPRAGRLGNAVCCLGTRSRKATQSIHSPQDTARVAFTPWTLAKSGWQQLIQSSSVWKSCSCDMRAGGMSHPSSRPIFRLGDTLVTLCYVSDLTLKSPENLYLVSSSSYVPEKSHSFTTLQGGRHTGLSFILENRDVLTLCFSGMGKAGNKFG